MRDSYRGLAVAFASVVTIRGCETVGCGAKKGVETTDRLIDWERTGLVVRASDSGSGDPASILGRVGVLFP